jgi:hypothetical protein
MRWTTFFLLLGILALASAGYVAVAEQESHRIERARHGNFVETTYNEDGTIFKQVFLIETWKLDGSRATDSYSLEPTSDTMLRQTAVVDLGRMLGETRFPYLGVKIVVPVPEGAEHQYHKRAKDCAATLAEASMGVQSSEDPYTREIIEADGAKVVMKYEPAVGCWPLEYTRTDAAGRIVSRRSLLGELHDGALDYYFEPDSTLRAVSRVDLVRARSAHFGESEPSPEALDHMRVLDIQKPFVVD